MSKPKTDKKASPKPPAAAPGEEPVHDIETNPTTITARERAFLGRVGRFLVNVQSERYLPRAARNGYTNDEHKEGWRLWSIAAGRDRSLAHWFTENQIVSGVEGIAADRLRVLQALDTFENYWFPRVRMILRRQVPRASRATFEAAFFHDLVQQPLSPAVVDSVGTLVKRVRQLETSPQPGAKQVYKVLVQRGMTPTKLKEIDALLKEAEEGSEKAKTETPVSPAEIAAAQLARREAYEDLKDWFNDMTALLRGVYNRSEELVLGLARRRGRPGDEEGGDEEEADDLDEEGAAEGEGEEAEGEEAALPAKPATAKPKGK